MEGKSFHDKPLQTNKTDLKGDWLEQRAKLKQKLSVLTEVDLLYEQGNK